MQRVALGAEPAEVGRVVRVTPHIDNAATGRLDDDAAANAAIAADAAGFR
jgi:hypothetical protein